MPALPADVAAAFEKRLDKIEAEIRDLTSRQAWVIRDPSGQARVVIGNLLPTAGLHDFGIAVWDEEEKAWVKIQPE